MKGNMRNNKNAYGSRKRPFSETINIIKSYYKKVRYLITDAPSFCKDFFNLKCNQITLRDCAIKNHAIHYIDINSRNAEEIYKEALARGDTDKAKMYKYIFEVMEMYVGDLESRKQFFVMKKAMKDINLVLQYCPQIFLFSPAYFLSFDVITLIGE